MTSDPAPEISIVIPTLNRVGPLIALLTALQGQDAHDIPFEILIVDNGSTDWTSQAVTRAAAHDARIRYMHEPRQGASHARNAGVACARAPIVAFLDDDVAPAHDWLSVLKHTFDDHPELDCVGGRVEPRWPRRVPRWLTAKHYAPLAIQIDRPADFDAAHAASCLITANFACRRRVFDEVGGFSAAFQRDEDREFNLRLWRAGKRGRYVDALRAVAPIVPERLTKRYHRQWYDVTGRNHARLRFREVIDRDGRLVEPMAGRRRLLGTPAFVYREFLGELVRWLVSVVRGARAEAFFYECRVRYFLGYIRERARHLQRTSA